MLNLSVKYDIITEFKGNIRNNNINSNENVKKKKNYRLSLKLKKNTRCGLVVVAYYSNERCGFTFIQLFRRNRKKNITSKSRNFKLSIPLGLKT